MKPFPRLRLRGILVVYATAASLVVWVTLGGYLLHLAAQSVHERDASAALSAAALLARQLAAPPGELDVVRVSAALEDVLASGIATDARVVDLVDGNRYESSIAGPTPVLFATDPGVSQAVVTRHDGAVSVSHPIASPGGGGAVARLEMRMAARDPGAAFRQTVAVAVIAAMALLCALGVAWELAQRGLTPLRRVTEAMRRQASGHLSIQAIPERADEFGELADLANRIAGLAAGWRDDTGRLEAAFDALSVSVILTDSLGEVTYVSRSAESALGIPARRLVGKSLAQIVRTGGEPRASGSQDAAVKPLLVGVGDHWVPAALRVIVMRDRADAVCGRMAIIDRRSANAPAAPRAVAAGSADAARNVA